MVVENLDTQDHLPKYRMSKGKESYNSVHIALETIKNAPAYRKSERLKL